METINENNNIVKPIVKWVGGKTQIIDKLLCNFPRNIENYHEPFLGGGSVLFALLSYIRAGIITVNGNIYAYDVNAPLIHMYKNIQSKPDELYNAIHGLIAEFNSIINNECKNRKPETIEEAKTSKESYYYWTRLSYNRLTDIEKQSGLGSAMFIFLNKTCFRGLFRVGPNGFNVPYGNYKNPEIINRGHLDEIHNLIQGVIFTCSDFGESISKIQDGDYAYLDPPYAPETATSFVGYTENGFGLDKHTQLFELCNRLTDSGNKKIMMSNADVILVRQHFPTDKYNIETILCKRSINAKTPHAKTAEIIIQSR